MTTASAVEARGLTKRYSGLLGRGGHLALRGVDLSIPRGTAFGLIGPNGAGKTTFIKSLLGVVRPTSGLVQVFGESPERPKVRARIGYLPERLHLPQAFKPRQFLASLARLKGMSRPEREIEELLARVGLASDAERKIGAFSKGMKQRLGLAGALLGKPELLVLDEPTDGVDPLGRMEIRRILADERARGATLFLNSHLLSETERICDRIGILSGGLVLREGPLEELRRAETRWLVRFAPGVAEPALLEAGFAKTPEGLWHFDAPDPAQLNAALDRARASGALLVELNRDSKDLEQVLAAALRGAA